MKTIYSFLALMLMYSFAFAQTNPTAQSLPYSQDFSGLAHSSTTYPAGWQGWTVATAPGGSFNTATPTADRNLIAGITASTNSGNVNNYNGKIGFLNTSSLDLSLVVAVSTTGSTNIEVTYDIMTIRNPYDGGSNTRINEVTLQYRVGTSGTFTTLTGIEYQNNTTTQTGAVTTPQNSASKTITLPAACDNQSVIQLRWISRQVSGAGSRPSFAVDNITIQTSTTKTLGIAAGSNATEGTSPTAGSFTFSFSPATTASTTFDYTFSGSADFTTDYTVTLSAGATPSPLTTSSGTITVPSGVSSVTATVTPIDDASNEGTETIGLAISSASDSYDISTSSSSINLLDDEPTFIHTIQGSGSAATAGLYTIEGIVTGVYPGLSPGGFYMQEEDADADANVNTSEGIFVFTSGSYSVGDKVRVSGTVQENSSSPSFSQAVIHTVTTSVISSGNALPSVSEVTLPVSAVSDFEKYECMLVHFDGELTVTENFNLGRFGEIHLSQGGIVYQPTQVIDPNDDPASGTTSTGSSNVAAVNALLSSNELRTILVDDGTGTMTSLPFVNSDNTLRIGSTTDGLTGIMGYGFSNYRVQPIPSEPITFTYATRPALPSLGTHNLTVASFNVLNYFNGDGTGGGFPTSRGAHSPAEFARQRAKIINAIAEINADVVGLTEIENDGTASTSAIADLVDGLNGVLGAGTYSYINDGASIQTYGTDAIRCAIIYKSDAVTPQGPVMIGSDAIFNRPPVAQRFTANSTCSDLVYIINHFKSKSASGASGADLDQGDGQGAYNDRRKQQSAALIDFIDNEVIPASGTDKVVTMGDYNSYYEEDPLDLFRASGYTVLGAADEYSYQFNGQLGSLDFGIVNSTLEPYVSGLAKWHINADEPTHLGYDDNTNDGSGDFVNPWSSTYSTIPFRSSDHDPVLLGLNMPDESLTSSITVTPANTTYTGGVPTNIYLGYGPQSATIDATVTGGSGVTYVWSPSTFLSCSSCEDPIFTPTAVGTYEYTLTATDDKGCTATNTVSFCVQDVRSSKGNNKIDICHNGNSLDVSSNAVATHLLNHTSDRLGTCASTPCEGANKLAPDSYSGLGGEVKVYPTPTNSILNVELPLEAEANVSIIDMLGKTIAKREDAHGLITFAVDGLAAGSYIVRVQQGNEVVSTMVTVY